MSHPVTLYLVRHGQTEFNLKGLAQGWSNSPLTDAGQEGAARLGAGLAREGVRFGLACSSDSGRAVDTARLILTHAGQADLPRRQDPRLREWCMGDFEAGPVDAFLEAFAAKFPGDPLHPDRFHALPDWADCLLEHNSEGAVQTFDGYVMQPYIQGNRMKLAAWQIVFALLFWTRLGGFLGLLLAIPLTAFVKASWGELRATSARLVGASGKAGRDE